MRVEKLVFTIESQFPKHGCHMSRAVIIIIAVLIPFREVSIDNCNGLIIKTEAQSEQTLSACASCPDGALVYSYQTEGARLDIDRTNKEHESRLGGVRGIV